MFSPALLMLSVLLPLLVLAERGKLPLRISICLRLTMQWFATTSTPYNESPSHISRMISYAEICSNFEETKSLTVNKRQ